MLYINSLGSFKKTDFLHLNIINDKINNAISLQKNWLYFKKSAAIYGNLYFYTRFRQRSINTFCPWVITP